MFKLGIIASAFRAVAALLLDTYPNASAAYSLRKLRTAYSGSAIRVRRSIDNSESDIGFDGSGNLNTAALQSFVGYQNLMIQSQTFNTSWTGINQTITLNATTDPIGGNTGNRMNETSANGVHLFFQSAGSSTGLCTISVYAKKFTRDWIRISEDGGTAKIAWFNINSGTIGTVQTGFQNAQIQSVGNGWYRCSVQITNKTGTGNFAIGSATANGVESFVGSASDGIYVWGAQFNTGSLQPYQQTTTVANTANGFVTTWYDQSGNSRNATQVTAANQPRIVNAGVLETQNGKPVVNFIRGSSNYVIANAPDFRVLHDIFAVVKSYGTQDGYDSYFGAGGAANGNVLWHRSATVDNALGITQPSQNIANNTAAINANTKLLNAYASSSLLTLKDVGLNLSVSGSITVLTGAVNRLTLSASVDGNQILADYISSYYSEFILYNSGQSANRAAINTNINSYYNIY